MQFFAATTLHTKLMKHWNEVPEDHYEPLKKRILEAIISYAMGPKIILNRLCITVCLLFPLFIYTLQLLFFSYQLILFIQYPIIGQRHLKN